MQMGQVTKLNCSNLSKNSILVIKASDLKPNQPLKTKVDLGCNFYCQAQVKNPNEIFIDIGLGCYVQFTLDEALRFIDKRTKLLEEKAKKLKKEADDLKGNSQTLKKSE